MFEDKRSEPLPTMATKEDLANAVKDEYGAMYSRDGLRLLKGSMNVERYEIKEGTRVICNGALDGCSSLQEVVIPASVTDIGNGAFSGCEALHVISRNPLFSAVNDCMLVDNVNHRLISSYNCKEHVAIPASVTSIGNYAFRWCYSLREATIPASVTSIGSGAFWWCESLREAAIPASVTSIGYGAFSGCSSLREIVIPASVADIGDRVFSGCEALHVISRTPLFSAVNDCMLVDNVNHRLISSYNCKEYVAIPASVTGIGDYAFAYCKSLREVVIPASVASIGRGAFEMCSSLREVVIPASVASIGDWAFYECSSLSSIIVPQGQAGRFRELLERSGCDLSAVREQGGQASGS